MFTRQLLNNILRSFTTCSVTPHRSILKKSPNSNRCKIFLVGNSRNIHCCNSLRGRSFVETENNFIYNVVNVAPLVDNDIFGSEQKVSDEPTFTSYLHKDWRNSNASDIVKAFKTLKSFCVSRNINFSDPRFDYLVDGLMDHCEKLTDHELLELLKCISEYPSCGAYTSHNFHDMWSCLDDICCWKMSSWNIDQLFAFADVWYKLKLGKLSDFIYEVLDRLVKKADKLNKDQLVHIFFYFNVCRKRPVDFAYEHALQHKIGKMNIDEMAVVALGFFKTQSKIKLLPIAEAMIGEVMRKAMGIHEISLTAIMKILRLSTISTKLVSDINKMLKALYPELDRFSELCCLHVALLSTGLQTFHEEILRKCSQKLVENILNTRIKDVERILNVLTMFTFDPKTNPDIFEASLQELHKESRVAEINNFPRCLASALHYLSLRGIYSYKLMDRVLDYEFITMNFGKHAKTLPQQLFSLDACVDIDCLDYTGSRLPSVLKYKAAKWLSDWPPSYDQFKKIGPKDKLFLDAMDAVEKIVGDKDLLTVQHVLPHFPTADIIICKDSKAGTFTKPKGFEQYVLGDVMKPFTDDKLRWFAVVVLTWNNTIRETSVPLGLVSMKLRQLEKIGFKPVTVIWNQFMRLSPGDKQEYILNQLN